MSSTTAAETDTTPATPPTASRLETLAYRYALVLTWIAVIAVFGVLRPDTFLTEANFATIFGSQAVLLILTLGFIAPLAAGEFDLSVAGTMSLSLVVLGWLNVAHGWPIGVAILVALLIGIVVGLVNSVLIVRVGVDSIVVTLGMGTLLVGAGLAISNETLIGLSSTLVDATRGRFLGIQAAFWFGLALTVIVWYVYRFTPLGRYVYFVGAGRDVARLTGLKVDAIRVGSLLFAGFMAALAGVILGGTLGASDPNVSAEYLLPAAAAAFLGSTAITPGRFNPWGSFVAVYFLVTGITGLELLGLVGWISDFFYGASLVIAVVLSRIVGRRVQT